MNIVENSYYQHEQYDLVKVVSISDGIVLMETQNKTSVIDGQRIPAGEKQSVADFEVEASPADISVDAETAVFDLNITETN